MVFGAEAVMMLEENVLSCCLVFVLYIYVYIYSMCRIVYMV